MQRFQNIEPTYYEDEIERRTKIMAKIEAYYDFLATLKAHHDLWDGRRAEYRTYLEALAMKTVQEATANFDYSPSSRSASNLPLALITQSQALPTWPYDLRYRVFFEHAARQNVPCTFDEWLGLQPKVVMRHYAGSVSEITARQMERAFGPVPYDPTRIAAQYFFPRRPTRRTPPDPD